MAFNRNHARPLCTDSEYQLFTASLADEIGKHTPVQLRGKIQRARKLRDKYRDLLKRQRLANRARTGTKKGDRTQTNVRTADKAKLFDEALGRFEAKAAKHAAAEQREAKRTAAKAVLAARIADKKKAGARKGQKTAAGKRSQARRDSRR